MEKKIITNKVIMFLAFLVFILLILIWFIIGMSQLKKSKYDYILDENWDVFENGELFAEDCDITKVNFGSLNHGDSLDFVYDLNSNLDGGYTIEILTYLCSMEAYVDDEEVYSYAPDLIDQNVMVGSGHHFIKLPKDVSGKTLTIHMIMSEKNAFTSVTAPRAAKTDNIELAFARIRFPDCLIGIFLLVLGFLLVICSVIAIAFDKNNIRLLLIGLFSASIGGWTIFSTKAWQVFSDVRGTNTVLEYLTLYFAPVPFSMLVCLMRKDSKSRLKRYILNVVFFIFLVFFIVSTILHYTNIYRYPSSLLLYHLIGMSGILTVIVVGFLSESEKTDADVVTALALVIFMAIGALDLFRFNIQKYILIGSDLLKNSFIPLGSLVFVMLLIVSYLLYLYNMIMTNTEKEMLFKMAYHDGLTGLFNRAKFEEQMSELDGNNFDFAIISFDLNGLKEINDTLGHGQGDALLISFSKVLLQTFYDVGVVYRTGGDEFVVIVDENSVGKIHECLVDFKMNEVDASKDTPFVIQASFGVAYRSEANESDSYKIYKLADKRMYEMKSDLKGEEYRFAKRIT